jgi:hypothetical protein
MFHMTLLGDAKALLSAAEGFELNAIHFQFPGSQARCAKAFAELTQHTHDLEKTLLEQRPNVQRWSLAQADRLALSIKGILGCIKNLIDFNENDVIVVVNQNLTLCAKACDALEQAKAHIPKHKANLTAVTDALKDQVSNRATVVKDTRVVDALLNLRRRLDPAVENCLNRGTTNDFATLRELLREAGKLFVPQFSEGDFAYKVFVCLCLECFSFSKRMWTVRRSTAPLTICWARFGRAKARVFARTPGVWARRPRPWMTPEQSSRSRPRLSWRLRQRL